MTRARDDVSLVVPLRFAVTSQAPRSGMRTSTAPCSRFLTEKVLKTIEETVFHGSHLGEAELAGAADSGAPTLDVAQRARQMW
ncbi:MAG: hypothetical protein U1F11_04795 [Steroidobacteraceae bacterium]